MITTTINFDLAGRTVAPTLVETPMLAKCIPQAFVDLTIDRTPAGRIAWPEDVAHVAALLLSDADAYVDGVILPVDGRLSAGLLATRSGAQIHILRAS